MVKKMLEVVVNYLYPALTTVKTDWLFLCAPDSVLSATSPSPRPSPLTDTRSGTRRPAAASVTGAAPLGPSEDRRTPPPQRWARGCGNSPALDPVCPQA